MLKVESKMGNTNVILDTKDIDEALGDLIFATRGVVDTIKEKYKDVDEQILHEMLDSILMPCIFADDKSDMPKIIKIAFLQIILNDIMEDFDGEN